MEQKFEEITKLDKEQADEYSAFIKDSVKDGSFFQDALGWYFSRYVTPICDRTLLIFGAILACVVLYFLIQMVQGAFPLVEKKPIFIRAVDQSNYFPELVALKPKNGAKGYDPDVKTVDEAVVKYLLSVYIKDRESFDFRDAEIEDVNRKFNRIKHLSSAAQYRAFQAYMSKDNPNSPIHNFGQNVFKNIDVQSVKFMRQKSEGLSKKALEYLVNKMPSQVEVRFVANTRTVAPDQTFIDKKEYYLVKIDFIFGGIDRSEKGGSTIKFTVNGYQLFKIK